MADPLVRLLRHTAGIGFSIWFLTVVSFLVVALAPGDAALSVLRVDTIAHSQAEIAAYRAQLGLDDPLLVRYWRYLSGLLRGDLGMSVMTGQTVAHELGEALPATALLALSSITVTLVLVVTLGTLAATHPDTWIDRLVSAGCYLGASMPTFWLGLLLIQWFAVDLRLLPASGWRGGAGLVLPCAALAVAIAPPFIKLFRNSFQETQHRDFVRSARARGVPERVLRRAHVLRASLIPVVTMMGVSLGSLLSGSVVVEAVFGLPGVGKLAVEAVTRRDYAVIQGFILVIGIAIIGINLLVDLSYRWISPEVRLKGTR
ncbi:MULTISPECIES: ABC transporter permease [unclassified Luteococcus]|uniref:ABC transporter permease n=1 Tax=unclassified Luteococcus TaxID=2639923 RepID=UPI00313BCE4A